VRRLTTSPTINRPTTQIATMTAIDAGQFPFTKQCAGEEESAGAIVVVVACEFCAAALMVVKETVPEDDGAFDVKMGAVLVIHVEESEPACSERMGESFIEASAEISKFEVTSPLAFTLMSASVETEDGLTLRSAATSFERAARIVALLDWTISFVTSEESDGLKTME
jgi:hypothetical protein